MKVKYLNLISLTLEQTLLKIHFFLDKILFVNVIGYLDNISNFAHKILLKVKKFEIFVLRKKECRGANPLPLPSVSKSVWVEYNLTQREDTSQSSIKLAILIFRLYSDFAGFSAYRGGISPPPFP